MSENRKLYHCRPLWQDNISLHLYSTFLGTQSALHRRWGISSSTTKVQHPPGWCDGSHIVPEHTPAYWWRGDKVMKPISVWGWLGGHDGQRPMGKYGQDAGVTPLLFFEGHPGIFNDHRESGPQFNGSSERWKIRIPFKNYKINIYLHVQFDRS